MEQRIDEMSDGVGVRGTLVKVDVVLMDDMLCYAYSIGYFSEWYS